MGKHNDPPQLVRASYCSKPAQGCPGAHVSHIALPVVEYEPNDLPSEGRTPWPDSAGLQTLAPPGRPDIRTVEYPAAGYGLLP